MNTLSITVGIPTYYGGWGLVETVKGIFASQGVDSFRIIVCVDGNPLKSEIESELKSLGAEVVFSAERGGQVARIKQMIGLCNTDLLVLTQDDIQFRSDTLMNLVIPFSRDSPATMVAARMLTAPAESFLEKIVSIGVNLTHQIGDSWRDGDNYLQSTGRCLAFQAAFIKDFAIPEEVINSDAYLYFENKQRGGKFNVAHEAIVYNRIPQKLQEHLKQSKKFGISRQELERYMKTSLSSEYAVPIGILTKAALREFFLHPILTPLYFMLQVYVKTQDNPYKTAQRFWDTDITTKRI